MTLDEDKTEGWATVDTGSKEPSRQSRTKGPSSPEGVVGIKKGKNQEKLSTVQYRAKEGKCSE